MSDSVFLRSKKYASYAELTNPLVYYNDASISNLRLNYDPNGKLEDRKRYSFDESVVALDSLPIRKAIEHKSNESAYDNVVKVASEKRSHKKSAQKVLYSTANNSDEIVSVIRPKIIVSKSKPKDYEVVVQQQKPQVQEIQTTSPKNKKRFFKSKKNKIVVEKQIEPLVIVEQKPIETFEDKAKKSLRKMSRQANKYIHEYMSKSNRVPENEHKIVQLSQTAAEQVERIEKSQQPIEIQQEPIELKPRRSFRISRRAASCIRQPANYINDYVNTPITYELPTEVFAYPRPSAIVHNRRSLSTIRPNTTPIDLKCPVDLSTINLPSYSNSAVVDTTSLTVEAKNNEIKASTESGENKEDSTPKFSISPIKPSVLTTHANADTFEILQTAGIYDPSYEMPSLPIASKTLLSSLTSSGKTTSSTPTIRKKEPSVPPPLPELKELISFADLKTLPTGPSRASSLATQANSETFEVLRNALLPISLRPITYRRNPALESDNETLLINTNLARLEMPEFNQDFQSSEVPSNLRPRETTRSSYQAPRISQMVEPRTATQTYTTRPATYQQAPTKTSFSTYQQQQPSYQQEAPTKTSYSTYQQQQPSYQQVQTSEPYYKPAYHKSSYTTPSYSTTPVVTEYQNQSAPTATQSYQESTVYQEPAITHSYKETPAQSYQRPAQSYQQTTVYEVPSAVSSHSYQETTTSSKPTAVYQMPVGSQSFEETQTYESPVVSQSYQESSPKHVAYEVSPVMSQSYQETRPAKPAYEPYQDISSTSFETYQVPKGYQETVTITPPSHSQPIEISYDEAVKEPKLFETSYQPTTPAVQEVSYSVPIEQQYELPVVKVEEETKPNIEPFNYPLIIQSPIEIEPIKANEPEPVVAVYEPVEQTFTYNNSYYKGSEENSSTYNDSYVPYQQTDYYGKPYTKADSYESSAQSYESSSLPSSYQTYPSVDSYQPSSSYYDDYNSNSFKTYDNFNYEIPVQTQDSWYPSNSNYYNDTTYSY